MIKGLLYLAILTTVVMISWVGFGIYHNFTTSTINADTSIAITPIPPQFDKRTIEKMKSKKSIDADLNKTKAEISTTPQSETPIATASSAATVTPAASSSPSSQLQL